MTTFKRRTGDKKDPIYSRLNDIASLDGNVSSIVATVRKDDLDIALAATVHDALECIVKIDLDPWLATAAVGTWLLKVKVFFADGAEWTWPREYPPDEIEVT